MCQNVVKTTGLVPLQNPVCSTPTGSDIPRRNTDNSDTGEERSASWNQFPRGSSSGDSDETGFVLSLFVYVRILSFSVSPHPQLSHPLTTPLPRSPTASLSHCLTPSYPHSLSPTPSLLNSHTPSHPISLILSLPHSLTPSHPQSI